MNESASSSHIRLTAAQLGVDLWRNNVGACTDKDGRLIRYGLCNDSAGLNKRIKSSDLIGITPVLITPDMVGQMVGVFTAVETKASDWQFMPNDQRAIAQAVFHDIVKNAGGRAGFARNAQELRMIVQK